MTPVSKKAIDPKLTPLRVAYRREIPAHHLKVWDWQRRAHAIDRLLPSTRMIEILRRPVHLCTGAILMLRIKFFFGSSLLRFEHENHQTGTFYLEELAYGPFLKWNHEHHFLPWKSDSTVVEDRLDIIATRYPWINRWLHPFLEKRLDALFSWRHHITHFDLTLWSQLPFSSQVHIFTLNPRKRAMGQRMKYALEPIPSQENDPNELIRIHEGSFVVLNTLGYRSLTLPHATTMALTKVHAHTLICFGHVREPKWLASLVVHADRIIYIQIDRLLKTWMAPWIALGLKLGWRPSEWCCEEDLLSCIFQIIHDRLPAGNYRLQTKRESPTSFSFFEKIKQQLQPLRQTLKLREAPQPLPLFTLRHRAFESLEQWLTIYGKW